MKPPRITDERRGLTLAALIGLALVQAGAAAAAAFATRWLFTAMDTGSAALPVAALAILAGAGVALAVIRLAFRSLGEAMGQDYARAVRLKLFEHAAQMWPRDVAARRAGYLSLRFVGDLTALKDWPARGLPLVVEAAIMLPAAIAILFVFHPGFGLIGMAIVGVALIGLALGAKGLARAHRRLRARRARLAADMTERMPLAPELAAAGRRGTEAGLIERRSRSLARMAVSRTRSAEALRALPDALTGIGAAALIWQGATAGLPAGTIAAGLAVLGLAATPLRNVMGVANRAAAFRAAHRKLAGLLLRPVAPAKAASIRLPAGPLSLELRQLVVAQSAPIALVLDTGQAGTLPGGPSPDRVFRAIAGREPIEAGQLLLGGIDIREVSPGSLRRGIALISDTPMILKGSLRRALTLGLSDRPADKTLNSRLRRAGLLPLLERLGGLDRGVSEQGRSLDRSERLDIAVLRASLARPGLILVAPGAEPDGIAAAWLSAQPATILRAA